MLLFSESQFCGTQVTFTSFLVFNFSFRKMFLPIGKTISVTILAGSHSFRKLFSRTIFLSDFFLRKLFSGTISLSGFFLAEFVLWNPIPFGIFPCGYIFSLRKLFKRTPSLSGSFVTDFLFHARDSSSREI